MLYRVRYSEYMEFDELIFADSEYAASEKFIRKLTDNDIEPITQEIGDYTIEEEYTSNQISEGDDGTETKAVVEHKDN